MEIRKDDEPRRVLARDTELGLTLERDVIDRRATLRHVQPGRRIEVEKIGTAQVAADEREPVDSPESERTDAAGGACVTEADQAHGQPSAHRPVSRRRANRSGSLAFLIARCAPLMS